MIFQCSCWILNRTSVKKPNICFYIEGWGTCRSQEPAENILINVRSTASMLKANHLHVYPEGILADDRMQEKNRVSTYSSTRRAVSGFSVAFRLVDSNGPPATTTYTKVDTTAPRRMKLGKWRNLAQSAIIIVNIVSGSLIQDSPLREGQST